MILINDSYNSKFNQRANCQIHEHNVTFDILTKRMGWWTYHNQKVEVLSSCEKKLSVFQNIVQRFVKLFL